VCCDFIYTLCLKRFSFWGELSKIWSKCVISGFRRRADENCAILGYYAASSGNRLFRGQESWPLKRGPIGCPETSVRNYHYSLLNGPEERSSQQRTMAFTYNIRYSCHISTKLGIFGQIIKKYPNMKFHENPSSGSRVVRSGQKGVRNEANSRFSQFRAGA